MRAATDHYWLKATLVSAIAFALGIAMYILVGIAVAHGETNANAAWHQVSVEAIDCDCVIKFVPQQPLPGSGTALDPFVTYNALTPIIVGVSGVGLVTIEDQHGHVLYTFNKTTDGYEELIAPVNLPDGTGMYELVVKLNGVEAIGPSVILPMFLDYRGLLLPPTTGVAGGYLYVGGYAVQTFNVLASGALFGMAAFLVFLIAAARRRRREAESTRSNVVFGKAMRRELSPKAIENSGVVMNKSRAKKSKKKSR